MTGSPRSNDQRPDDQRPDWDTWALGIASAVSTRSECIRAKHGCVILDSNHHIVSTGYNGLAPGDDRTCEGDCPRAHSNVESLSGYDECLSTHAEQHAVIQGDSRMIGSTAYITGRPCFWCEKTLKSAGVSRIVHYHEETIELKDDEFDIISRAAKLQGVSVAKYVEMAVKECLNNEA